MGGNIVVRGASVATVQGGSYITFADDSTEKMRITGSYVGIGTTNPGAKLDVRDAGTSIPSLGSEGTGFKLARTDGVAELIAGYVATNNGDFYIQTQRNDGATASNLLLNPNGGNVGIGTASPTAALSFGVASTINTLAGALTLAPADTGVSIVPTVGTVGIGGARRCRRLCRLR